MAANGSELFLDKHTRIRKIQQIAAFLAQIEGKDPQVNTTNQTRTEQESEIYFYTRAPPFFLQSGLLFFGCILGFFFSRLVWAGWFSDGRVPGFSGHGLAQRGTATRLLCPDRDRSRRGAESLDSASQESVWPKAE